MAKKPIMTMTEEAQKFYAALGQCITMWSHIEGRLFLVCNLCLRSDEAIAAIVFFRTPSLEARISLSNDLVTQRLQPEPLRSGQHPPKLLKLWSKVHAELKQNIFFRNYIAHQPDSVDVETLWAIARARKSAVDDFDQLFDESTFIKQHRADNARRPMQIDKAGLAEMLAHLETMGKAFEALNEFSNQLHVEMRSLD